MNYARSFQQAARKFGQPVILFDRQGEVIGSGYAFVQPISAESKENFWRELSPLGAYDGSLFRFLGEADLLTDERLAEYLRTPNRWFHLRTLQPVYLGSQLFHWAGTLTQQEEKEECPCS
jgi:hypothetical protein